MFNFQQNQNGLLVPDKSVHQMYDEMNFNGFKLSNMFDDNTSMIFARQLTQIMSTVLDVQYDDLKLPEIFPMDTSGGTGLQSLIQVMMDKVGSGNIISATSTDIPSSDVEGSEHLEPVHTWATHVSWTRSDMLRAGRAGVPLDNFKRAAASYVAAKFLEGTAIGNDPIAKKHYLRGLFTDPSLLTAHTLPADGTGTKKAFSTKTGDLIVRDVQAMYAASVAASRGKTMFTPDTWVGTPGALVALQQKQLSTNLAYSAIRYLKENSTIQNFIAWPALYDAVGGKDAMFLFKKSPMIASFKLPSPLMALPVQYADLKYKVYFVQDVGGLHLNYPYAITYAVED